jgi:hypothetical protein
VDKSTHGFDYDFTTSSTITKLSLAVLKPHGKLLARGNCVGAVKYRSAFESDVQSLGCQFVRRDVYVPSFHEVYCLYEIIQAGDDITQLNNGAPHTSNSQEHANINTDDVTSSAIPI